MPCSPKLKRCVDDLIAQGKPEDSAWAICRSQLGETYRHRDFQRIHDEFVNYYKDSEQGESEYYSWLTALNLNEEREYGQAQESFKWAKNMLQYLREDDQYKYYKVLVGFPVKSMNGNVYKERDLIAAALRLKGVHPTLNHKDQWHFTPESRWGEITTEDARYEDGATEAVLRVSKKAVCPICDGKPMTELIDSKHIVNVSLQGGCNAQSFDGVCDGFQFDDKGFSLLTSDVLPGIPMARIFPLESIMVEALQSSTRRKTTMKKKIVMEVLEDDDEDEIKPGSHYCEEHPDDPRCKEHQKAIHGEQSTEMQTVDITPMEPTPSMEPDENGQCQPGYMLNAIGKCVQTEDCGEGRHWDANANDGQGACVADTPPKPEHPETAHGLPAAPREDVLTDGPTEVPTPEEQPPVTGTKKLPATIPAAGEQPTATMAPPEPSTPMKPRAPGELEPKPSHDCGDGYHYDYDLNQCVPDQPIVERVKRIKAELRAKSAEEKATKWEYHYVQLDEKYQQLRGTNDEQKNFISQLRTDLGQLRTDLTKAQVNAEKHLRERDEAKGQRDDAITKATRWEKAYREQVEAKDDALEHAKKMVEKNTKLSEEWLEQAAKIEHLESQLKKAKDIGKKIYRIKV